MGKACSKDIIKEEANKNINHSKELINFDVNISNLQGQDLKKNV